MRTKSYDGGLSLEETSVKVVEFESIGWVVSDWRIVDDKNQFDFELHPEGGHPTPCMFRRKGAKALPGFVKIKAGRLLAAGAETDVVLYRWEG